MTLALAFTGENAPAAARGRINGRETIKIVDGEDPAGQPWSWLVITHETPGLVWHNGCSDVYVDSQGWLTDRQGAAMAFRSPHVSTNRFSYVPSGIDTFTIPEDDRSWTSNPSAADDERASIDLMGRWLVTSASADPVLPESQDARARQYMQWMSFYDRGVVVFLQDPSAVGEENSRRTRLGITLGIGLTLAIEALLGFINAVANREERSRLIRPPRSRRA